jgi:hypothetical protein
LNWYTYCGGNPIALIDPFGLAEVGLRNYAESHGATVQWDDNNKRAVIAYNGTIKYVYSNAKNNRNGRIYVDDSLLNDWFGWGQTLTIGLGTVKLTNVPNDRNIPLKNGWSYRYEVADPHRPGDANHIHLLYEKSQDYSQEDDGRPHHGPKGGSGPPKSIQKLLKDKTGWDWGTKDQDWLSKISVMGPDDGNDYYITYPDGRSVVWHESRYYGSVPRFGLSATTLYGAYFSGSYGGSKGTLTSPVYIPVPNSAPISFSMFAPFSITAFGF